MSTTLATRKRQHAPPGEVRQADNLAIAVCDGAECNCRNIFVQMVADDGKIICEIVMSPDTADAIADDLSLCAAKMRDSKGGEALRAERKRRMAS